jgi:hypothetical protein
MNLKPLLLLFLAGVILLSGILINQYVLTYSAHAEVKHGDDARAVRHCLEQQDPLQVWVDAATGRVFNVCQLQDGRFGIQICDGTRECTSFIYRASKGLKVKLSQVENYLRNNVGAWKVGP